MLKELCYDSFIKYVTLPEEHNERKKEKYNERRMKVGTNTEIG
jgi:hypothetical protein